MRVEVRLHISMELPNQNSIVLRSSYKHSVVERVEHAFHDGGDLADKRLVEERDVRLSVVVPHFQQVVLAARKHETAVFTQIGGGNSAGVHSVQFAQVNAFETGKTVHSDTLVFCDHNNFSAIFGKLVASNDLSNRNLVNQNDGV